MKSLTKRIFWGDSEDKFLIEFDSEEETAPRFILRDNLATTYKGFKVKNRLLVGYFQNSKNYQSIKAKNLGVSVHENKNEVRAISLKCEENNIWYHQFFEGGCLVDVSSSNTQFDHLDSGLIEFDKNLHLEAIKQITQPDMSYFLGDLTRWNPAFKNSLDTCVQDMIQNHYDL